MKSKLPKNRKLNAGLYIGALCVISLFLYSTLFARTYNSVSGDPNVTATTSTDPGTGLIYKTYPKKGKMTTVMLDAGHGGLDGGNVANGDIQEKDINLSMTNKVRDYLNELNPNIQVKMIRTDDNVPWLTDEETDLNYRLEQQTKQNAEYYFSLHCNSFEDPSVEGPVFFVNPTDTVMKDLTNKMGENLEAIGWCQEYNVVDNRLLQVVTMSEIHSTLIEMGYMTNAEDLAHLTSSTEQDKAAKTIAATISDYIMENPDAPKYEKPKQASTTESASSMASVESQTASEHAAQKSEADAAANPDGQNPDPNQAADPNQTADLNQQQDPNANPEQQVEQPPVEEPPIQ
ncbi:MAG: N-acetylmuramoyl-L-alanine amidase [Allobaculum sp.]